MSVSDATIDWVKDLFHPLGEITTRKMMGGLTVYADGQVFSIISRDGTLYLKADGDFAAKMETAGARKFTFEKNGKPGSMGYWTMPEDALDDDEAALTWAREALDALR